MKGEVRAQKRARPAAVPVEGKENDAARADKVASKRQRRGWTTRMRKVSITPGVDVCGDLVHADHIFTTVEFIWL